MLKSELEAVAKIIVEKDVDMGLLKKCGNAVSYNYNVYAPQTLKINEYELLKKFANEYGGKRS